MSKWTSTILALVVLVAVSVHTSPIGDGATNKVMGRQETAATAEVVTPAAPAAVAGAEDDEDDDDDDDYGLGLDDDEEDDDAEEDDEEDDDDDDDYLERFFDDILADDDDDDDDDEKPVVKPTAKPTLAPVVTSAPAAAKPSEADDDDYDDEEEDSNVAASETSSDDDDEQAEKDDGDDNELSGYDDDEEELQDDDDEEEDYEEDETDIVSAKRSRALKTPKMPAAHLAKYNNFVDTIIERINEVVKKSFDPVTVRLTRGSPAPPSRRPVKNDPKQNHGKVGDEGPSYELVSVSRHEDLALGRSNDQSPSPTPEAPKRPRARPNKNKGSNKQNNRQRARATLMGLSSMRREGDVTVNSMSEHTTIRSRFLLGPLTLRVEKQFGRGAKKELRSATATTDKMTGRMVLRVNRSGVATLHSVRVLQPKQVRVESDDDHDQTREFVWRRSSHIARLVSQKLTKAARELLQAKAGQANH